MNRNHSHNLEYPDNAGPNPSLLLCLSANRLIAFPQNRHLLLQHDYHLRNTGCCHHRHPNLHLHESGLSFPKNQSTNSDIMNQLNQEFIERAL